MYISLTWRKRDIHLVSIFSGNILCVAWRDRQREVMRCCSVEATLRSLIRHLISHMHLICVWGGSCEQGSTNRASRFHQMSPLGYLGRSLAAEAKAIEGPCQTRATGTLTYVCIIGASACQAIKHFVIVMGHWGLGRRHRRIDETEWLPTTKPIMR
jgi:hypothetical protein